MKILIFFYSLIHLSTEQAPRVFVRDESDVMEDAGPYVYFYPDSLGELSIEEIVTLSENEAFTFHNDNIFNYPPSEIVYWFQITVQNKTKESLWIELGNSFSVSWVDFYAPDSLGRYNITPYQTGAFRGPTVRLLSSNIQSAPLSDVEDKTPKTYFFRIESRLPKIYHFKIGGIDELTRSTLTYKLPFAFFFGLVLAILIYNLFLFISSGNTLFLKYASYLLVMLIMIPLTQGHPIFYHPWFWRNLLFMNAALFLAVSLFVTHFLSLKELSIRLFRALWLGASILIVIIPTIRLFDLINGFDLAIVFQVCSSLFYLYLIGIGIYSWVKGYALAKYYVIAWTSLVSGIIGYYLTLNGLTPINFFTQNILYLAVATEALLFAFALGSQLNLLRHEKDEAQAESIRLINEQNKILDQKVKKKTQELEASFLETQALNEQLKATNKELEDTLIELSETQESLIEQEKLASIGVLTAGVAHEINNPLNFIKGGIAGIGRFLKDRLSDDYDEIKPAVNAINTGVERASKIVKSLGRYSRSDTLETNECNVQEILEDCLTILQHKFKKGISIKKLYTDSVLSFEGNEGRIHQAFLNVLDNSIQSIEEKGTIEIETFEDNQQAVIKIKDNGSGIEEANLKRVFDPFFTTKPPGEGTGLGLSITQRIINEHRGTIRVHSTLNEGAEVIIRLPLQSQPR